LENRLYTLLCYQH